MSEDNIYVGRDFGRHDFVIDSWRSGLDRYLFATMPTALVGGSCSLRRRRARWRRTRTMFGESPTTTAMSRGARPSHAVRVTISRSILGRSASAALRAYRRSSSKGE